MEYFYGGTRAGTIGNPDVTVRLSSLEGPTDPLKSTGTWITSSQNFRVGALLVAKGSAARIARFGAPWKVFTTFHGCAAGRSYGPWTMTVATVHTAVDPGDDITKMLKVCANGRSYRRTLNPVPEGASLALINRLPIESYLRGVVPRESPASWGDAAGGRGMAALQAQAVAARSYAQAENRYPPDAKTCETILCQVYGGAGDLGLPIKDVRTDKAVAATAGQVRLDPRNGLVRTEFSASTGGWTAPGGLWPAVQDLGDSLLAFHTWTVTLNGAALAGRYSVGSFMQVLVTAQNRPGAEGGRAGTVRIVGSTKSITVSAQQFASDWNLGSDWFFTVDQPLQQVAWLHYVKPATSPQIYRQFHLAAGGWTDYAPIGTAEWQAKGSPVVATVAALS